MKHFLSRFLKVPDATLDNLKFEAIECQEQARRSKISDEYLVRFFNSQTRDVIQSFAVNLASAKGAAGLRMDVPDALRGLFCMFECLMRKETKNETTSFSKKYRRPGQETAGSQ